MGAIGFGAGVRPPGAGRAGGRRGRGYGAVASAPPGGGDIRRMRNVGGYSTVGFRALPPIGREPVEQEKSEADVLTDAILARADEVLAQADEMLAAADEEAGAATTDAYAEAATAGPAPQAGDEPAGDELAGAGASR